jgi:RNA-binding protein YhbY
VLPLRVWRELSKDRGSEIVADAKAIENLFNDLRSISRPVTVTRENVQTVDSLGNILPTKQVEEVQDLAEVVIDALKANGIENQSITYKQIEETLTGYFDLFSVDNASDVLAFGAKVGTARKEIFDLQAAREILQKEANTRAAKVDAELRTEISSMLDSSTHADTVMEYSNQALEYYIYSETKSQFNNLADELAPWGIKPSYGVYQRLLGDIAHTQVTKVKIFQGQLDDAENILRQIQTEVQNQPASQQGIFLRGKLMQALDNEADAAVLDAVFPEIRAAVPKVKLADLSRLQANDEILQDFRQQILVQLRKEDTSRYVVKDAKTGKTRYATEAEIERGEGTLVSGQARVGQRAGYLMGTGTSGRQAQAVPTVAGAVGGRGTPQPGKPQIGINQLISELEGAPSNVNMLTFVKRVREVAKNRMSEKQYVDFNSKLQVIEDGVTTRVQQLKDGLKQTQEANKSSWFGCWQKNSRQAGCWPEKTSKN